MHHRASTIGLLMRTMRTMAKTRRQDPSYQSRQFLLTRNELAFFHALQLATNGRVVPFAKVRLADVVACADSQWHGCPGRKIAQKHLDFVLCDPITSRIVAAIELDDRTHRLPERRRRDAFLDRLFRDVGIPLLRCTAKRAYEPENLRKFLARRIRIFAPIPGVMRPKTRGLIGSGTISGKPGTRF